jgi:arginine decarboxylase
LHTVCEDAGVRHPNIISESGRAIAAYHAVLVFGVLGVAGQGNGETIPDAFPDEFEQPLHTLLETYKRILPRNLLESFHDAQQALDMAMNLFAAGYLPLDQRSIAETLFWAICGKLRDQVRELDYTPDELKGLDRMLSETYFGNFSLFQSMPDSWAIKQLFPLMPIHRLNERPTHHAILGDITCDSDGKIDQFIDLRDVKHSLRLHEFDGSPYCLGAFLVGAYQEILGDLHNLFGDTNTVSVDMAENGEVVLGELVRGDTVHEVLRYVSFNYIDLVNRLQGAVETAVQGGLLDHSEAGRFVKFYEAALHGYTYMEEPER